MPVGRMTDLTKTRQALLDGISDRFECELTLFLFADVGESGLNLLTAYASVHDNAVLELMRNRIHHIDCADQQEISEDRIRAEAAVFVQAMGLPDYFPHAEFFPHVLKTECSPFDYACEVGKPRIIGVLVTAGRMSANLGTADLDQLATDISIGRSHRFISTVMCTQNNLAEPGASLDDAIQAVTTVFARELGAGTFLYRNKNKDSGWTEFLPPGRSHGTIDDPAAPPTQRLNMTSESDEPDLDIARRPRDGETLEVTLSQCCYKISKLRFDRPDRLAETLRTSKVRSQAIGISFRYKDDPGYLQNRFSETDQRIAEAVFNNLQNFAELKLADESYGQVFAILHGNSFTWQDSAKEFLRILRPLSRLIDNVHIITVSLLDHDIEVKIESGEPGKRVNGPYIARLKDKYLDKFYYGGRRPDYNHLAIGMDADDGHYFLEVHTPREFGDSRVYLISFSEGFIAQTTFNALTNLFGELFTRMREEDLLEARSNTLTETRHTVIHHFGAAHQWIGLIKTDWDMGLRSKGYWMSLLDEPDFADNLDWANWSLGQAQLLLENGRFLSEIDAKSIARKPINILQIILDCQNVLRIESRRKLLKMRQEVRGKAPSGMTGDEVLMKIAILNLLDNAIKYSLNKGVIRWELIYKPDRYEFRISNRGDPIPEKRYNLLLQVGYRGKQRDHLNVRPGTGLGLPVAHRILSAHSDVSELKLHSEKHSEELGGATNTFYFEMPYLTGLSNVGASEGKGQ